MSNSSSAASSYSLDDLLVRVRDEANRDDRLRALAAAAAGGGVCLLADEDDDEENVLVFMLKLSPSSDQYVELFGFSSSSSSSSSFGSELLDERDFLTLDDVESPVDDRLPFELNR